MDRQNNEFFYYFEKYIISQTTYLYNDRIIRGRVVAKSRRDCQQKDGGIFGYMTYIVICLMCSNLIVMLFMGSKFKARQ